MRKVFTTTLVAVLAVMLMSTAPAFADKGNHHHKNHHNSHWNHNHWKHGHWNHNHHKSGLTISLFSGWPGYYYSSYPHYSVVKPVYVTQPVYVQPPVQQVIFADNSNGYQADNGQYCREYQALVFVGGKKQQSYGTACYQPDGSWKVID